MFEKILCQQRAKREEERERQRELLWTPQAPLIWDEEAELADKHLSHFIRASWPVLEPDVEYLDNWHVDCISEHLEAVTAGQIKRLLVNIPPRYMKSTIMTIMWPVWEWLRKPGERYVFDAYAEDLMVRHSRARRNIIESPWFQARYCDRFALAKDANRQDEFHNNFRGEMNANRAATGKGGNRVISDDPLDPERAHSKAERDASVRRFNEKLSTRLNDKKNGFIGVVMQRVHSEDVSGRCIELGYTHLKLPGVARERTIIIYPMSGKIRLRKPGDILWPEREGAKEHADAKKQLGSYGYAAQYDQEPAPIEGGIVKREWWRYYKVAPPLTRQLQSWDMTYKDTENADHVGGCVIGCNGADRYILDLVCERMSFQASKSAIVTFRGKHPRARRVLIEDAANGPAIENSLKRSVSGIILVGAMGSKEERVHAVAPEIEAGNVFLPLIEVSPNVWAPPAWVEDLVRRFAQFPKAELDDDVDSVTQGLIYLADKAGRKGRTHNYFED